MAMGLKTPWLFYIKKGTAYMSSINNKHYLKYLLINNFTAKTTAIITTVTTA